MTDRETMLLLLVARMNQTWGKTRVQKLVFIAEALAETSGPLPFQYYLYKHGPFSLDVAFTLDSLRDKKEINENLRRTVTGNPVYLYTLSEAGHQRLAREIDSTSAPWRTAIDAAVRSYGNLDLTMLVEEAYAHARRRPELLQPTPSGAQ